TRSKWLFVMAKPSGSFSSEMVAVVSSLHAVIPAFPNCPESAMVKQPACAAASNSSGLVPVPFSNRALKEYGVCRSTPLSVETVPLPSFNPPCHTAEPLRCMFSSPRSEEHTSELQSRFDLVELPSFTTRRSSDLGKRHGEAARVRRGQQLFRISPGAILKPRAEGIWRLPEHAALG